MSPTLLILFLIVVLVVVIAFVAYHAYWKSKGQSGRPHEGVGWKLELLTPSQYHTIPGAQHSPHIYVYRFVGSKTSETNPESFLSVMELKAQMDLVLKLEPPQSGYYELDIYQYPSMRCVNTVAHPTEIHLKVPRDMGKHFFLVRSTGPPPASWFRFGVLKSETVKVPRLSRAKIVNPMSDAKYYDDLGRIFQEYEAALSGMRCFDFLASEEFIINPRSMMIKCERQTVSVSQNELLVIIFPNRSKSMNASIEDLIEINGQKIELESRDNFWIHQIDGRHATTRSFEIKQYIFGCDAERTILPFYIYKFM